MSKSPTRRVFPPAPTTARAVLFRAHPLKDSFNDALADAWAGGAETAGARVQTIDVHDLSFDPALRVAHKGDMPLEPDLREVTRAIEAAAHVVVAFPLWWGSSPALLKGLFDRVFLPGWAYAMGDNVLPDKGLRGRSGRLLVTMDVPLWYDRLIYGRSGIRQIKNATFHFTGIKPTHVSGFGWIESTTPQKRARMLNAARADGLKDGRALVRRFGPAPEGELELPIVPRPRALGEEAGR